MSKRLYDALKFLAQILLPALGTLYFTLAGIWGLPAAEAIVGTIVAIDTFLGVILRISSNAYNKSDAKFDGAIDIRHTQDGVKQFNLVLKGDPNDLEDFDEVLFKVDK